LGRRQKDLVLKSVLDDHDVPVIYFLDRIKLAETSEDKRKSWNQDGNHLTEKGHKVWGELMQEELEKWIHKP
jgi:lysophospholipase L1-like esterase